MAQRLGRGHTAHGCYTVTTVGQVLCVAAAVTGSRWVGEGGGRSEGEGSGGTTGGDKVLRMCV